MSYSVSDSEPHQMSEVRYNRLVTHACQLHLESRRPKKVGLPQISPYFGRGHASMPGRICSFCIQAFFKKKAPVFPLVCGEGKGH